MRQIILLVMGFCFAATLQAQKLNDSYLMSKLNSGYPAQASIYLENLPLVKSTSLETGTDSIKFLFGSYEQEDEHRYWAIVIKDKRRYYESVPLQKSDSTNMLSQDVDFGLDNGSEKISVRILFNPETDEVFYQWINKDGNTKIASVQRVERAIEKNAPMPRFSVETIDGHKLALDDFKGKYLVINWWSTTCKPCLLEMPGLNKMVEEFKSRPDVEFIAIAHDEKEKLEKFLTKRDFKYQQALSNAEVASTFGLSFPKHIVVNPQGIVTFLFVGGYADVHEEIEKYLFSQLRGN